MNKPEMLELLRLDAQRAIRANPEAWQKVQARTLLEFMANNGGEALDRSFASLPTVNERLDFLRSLGYRVVERFSINACNPKDPNEEHQCCYLSGGLWANLSDAYVGRR